MKCNTVGVSAFGIIEGGEGKIEKDVCLKSSSFDCFQ